MTSLDYFRHDFAACRLQGALTNAGQEPHTFVFVAAVNDMDAVVCHCAVERGARIFGDESEESVPPGILGVRKDLFADLLELFKAGCSNGFRDGFATLFVKALKIEFFEWHKKHWVFILARRFPRNHRRGPGTGSRVREDGKPGSGSIGLLRRGFPR